MMRDQSRFRLRSVLALGVFLSTGCGEPPSMVPAPQMDKVKQAQEQDGKQVAPAQVTDEQHEATYLAAKEMFSKVAEGDGQGLRNVLQTHGPKLRVVADSAGDTHLRANASLMLGRLYEGAEDRKTAISYYRQARDLLPNELAISQALAIALAGDSQFSKAAPIQRKIVDEIPDDLAARLLLGEILLKAGREDDATRAYAEYEMRRKGLIDGLTLHDKQMKYAKPTEERIECALALAPARDNGTAMALLYALKFDPEVKVRTAVVEAMGIQRLAGYTERLQERLKIETDSEMQETIKWALAEIERDPVQSKQDEAPAAPAEDEAPATTG